MLAAGWGATATVMESAALHSAALSTPSVWRHAMVSLDPDIRPCRASDDGIGSPEFLREIGAQEPESLEAITRAVIEHLAHGGRVEDLAALRFAWVLRPDARLALDQAVALGASDGHAWLLLAHWTNARTTGVASPSIAATLQPHLDALDASLIDKCMELFDRLLGGYATNGWSLTRAQRLRLALTRAVP